MSIFSMDQGHSGEINVILVDVSASSPAAWQWPTDLGSAVANFSAPPCKRAVASLAASPPSASRRRRLCGKTDVMTLTRLDVDKATEGRTASVPSLAERLVGAVDLIGFVALHAVAVIGVVVVGVSWATLGLLVATYTVRSWAVSAGFHRYFSHHSFATSRQTQFAIALVGATSMQKGALWWASTHRRHHRHSDTPLDPHSPQHRSFLYSHCGWVFDPAHQGYDPRIVSDLVAYCELVWLERLKMLPVVALAAGLWLAAGPQGFVWGFCVSTVVLWHTTLSTGSFSHRIGGYRNFDTPEGSRNNKLIALLLIGEGWHNNHHRSPNSARHSTGRHEPDPIYASIRLLAKLGLVWSVRDNLPAPGR